MDMMYENVAKKKSDAREEDDRDMDKKVMDEMKQYSAEPNSTRNENPIFFWKHNENKFPHLCKVALVHLAAQATNCASERVNSVRSIIFTDKRHNLSRYKA